MPTTAPAKRGPYAKTEARRAAILEAALEAYASSGRQGPSLRSIAESVGLTEAGVLHHFASKDHLLVAILEARDALAGASFDLSAEEGSLLAVAETLKTPGLVKLFVDMSAAAADPDHPAAEFMRIHAGKVIDIVKRQLGSSADWEARVLLAAAEGLQLQWLRGEDVDVATDLSRLYLVLAERLEATP